MKMKILLSVLLISSIMLTACNQQTETKENTDTVSIKTKEDNTIKTMETDSNSKKENEYFERLSEYDNAEDLTEIKEKNYRSIDKDIFYIYDKDITDPNETKYPISGVVEIGKDLLLEEKLEILCEAIKEQYKK